MYDMSIFKSLRIDFKQIPLGIPYDIECKCNAFSNCKQTFEAIVFF